jgi:pimeloyl-ACP methyl ester carboxylesterase
MPDEADPRFAIWRPVVQREIASLRSGAIVVGHSVGGTVLINTLADTAPPDGIAAVVLIAAPYIGEGGWETEEIAPRTDLADRLPATAQILLYHGADDAEVPVAHVERYAAAIPRARVRKLTGRDHQLNDDLSEVARDIRELVS